VTTGIISARGRDINAGPYDDFLQTDAPINRGNSGGPMFNLDGEVIGINTAIFSPSGGSVGIGFAIPASTARPVIEQLIKHGQVRRGWLGVRIQAVTEEIAETLGLNEAKGALVATVIEGGPAEEAGIRAGDIVLEFDGKDVEEMRRLPRIVADTDVEKSVDVVLWRDGRKQDVKVKVGALDEGEEKMAARAGGGKESKGASDKIDDLGLTVAVIDDKLRERFEIDADTKGVVVTEVDASGNAAEKGVRPGDVIVEVSQEPVSTPADVLDKIKAAVEAKRKSLLLLIEGEAGVRWVAVRIGKD
jgi:serine protease Do